jgi:KDO2-lipid IV(A) lauroyltransferase
MPSSRSVRHLIEFGLVRILIAALRLLPIDTAARLVGRLAMLVGPRTSLHRRALRNIEAALPEKSADDRCRILQVMWRNTGFSVAETLMLDRILADPRRMEILNAKPLVEALAVPGAQIGVTPHFGSWELIAWAVGLCGGRLAGIYRPLRNPWIDRYVQARREPLYPAGLLFKGTRGGTRELGVASRAAIDFLRKGGHLGFTADQVERAAPFTVPFFGHDATFSPAPALFARRLGARLWIGICLRIDDSSRFRFVYREIDVRHTSDVAADIEAITADIAAQFEAWVRQTPEQWMWWQRRTIGVLPAARREPCPGV